MTDVASIARQARAASRAVQSLTAADRTRALEAVLSSLRAARAEIESANAADLAAASARGADGALQKRLDVSGRKFDAVLTGLSSVIALPDPVGSVTLSRRLDAGLELYRVSAPIGVLAIVFEARPEAGVQIAALSIKSANALILKGGSEAARSNAAVAKAVRAGLARAQYPVDAVQLLETRAEVKGLLAQTECVDLVIPRGSNALVRFVSENTKIPVMGHADGLCAVYVDAEANVEKAVAIAVDAKAQYPAVCNAAETLLIDRKAVGELLPPVARALVEAGVELRADLEAAAKLTEAGIAHVAAGDKDFDTEFLELTIAVAVVDGVEGAVRHVNEHGSGHTDVIVSECDETARTFLAGVDSAGVYHNVSSRFADGFRYGFGAEVGISTHRTHARGPVGLEGLLIYKYKMLGKGHIVKPYADGSTAFRHEDFDPSKGEHKHLL